MRSSRLWLASASVALLLAGAARADKLGEVLPTREEDAQSEEEGAAESAGEVSGEENELVGADADLASGRFQLGLRTGFALGLGKIEGGAGGTELGDAATGQLPIWVDVGFRITPNWYAGAYASWGFVLAKSESTPARDFVCDGEADCSGQSLRYGLQGQYHFAPGRTSFWLGLGIGGESVQIDQTDAGVTWTAEASGIEFANLQLGVDFPTGESSTAGLFTALTVSQYANRSVETGSSPSSGGISNQELHHWIFVGLRGTTDF